MIIFLQKGKVVTWLDINMYDFELIKNLLEDVGFSGATRCQYQQGRVPDIDFLDVYPEILLFVEAISSNQL